MGRYQTPPWQSVGRCRGRSVATPERKGRGASWSEFVESRIGYESAGEGSAPEAAAAACSLRGQARRSPPTPTPVWALSPASPAAQPTLRGEGAGNEGLLPVVTSAMDPHHPVIPPSLRSRTPFPLDPITVAPLVHWQRSPWWARWRLSPFQLNVTIVLFKASLCWD